jgi:serine/threonine protein phosphatase PrpC
VKVGPSFEYSREGQSGGKPKENQDSTMVLAVSDSVACYGVFDGHGAAGAAVSQFVTEHLRAALERMLQVRVTQEGVPKPGVPDQVRKALPREFLATENALKAQLSAVTGLEFDGSTGTLAVRIEDRLLVAWLGDTRAVLGDAAGRATLLTDDHVPMRAQERQRIEASGGMVAAFPDEPPPEESGKGRVFLQDQMWPGLAVSRAFGDLVAKQAGVVAEPEVVDVTLSPEDAVLIIASDGVWDVTSSAEAVEMCMQYRDTKDAILAASDIVNHARQQWEMIQAEAVAEGFDAAQFSIDDISCVAVFLQPE